MTHILAFKFLSIKKFIMIQTFRLGCFPYWRQAYWACTPGRPFESQASYRNHVCLSLNFASDVFASLSSASEKKALASRSNVGHHGKVSSWSGSLSSAMRLMPGRQTKDSECKAEVSPDPFALENIRHSLQIPVCYGFSLSPLDRSCFRVLPNIQGQCLWLPSRACIQGVRS